MSWSLPLKTGKSPRRLRALLEGVELTLKKLRKVLEQEGVTPIENPEGKIFDPSKHNAVFTEEKTMLPEGTVLEEIRKGYVMRGNVIRPTIVKVAVKKSENQSNKTEEKSK